MKRCPSCNNTFDDNLRFCQNDGTPLLDEPAGKPAEDDPLQIPDFDPNKTAVFSAKDEMDVLATPPPPSFGDLGSLPTPAPESFSPPPPPSMPDSYLPPPIGQPENQPIPSPSQPPPFAEPEQIYQPPPSPFDSPFSPPQGAGASPDWNPPPAPVQQWGDQASGFGANTPFQPPGAAVGQKKGLAVAAMICGILSIPCCWLAIILGPLGAIMGFIAKNKVDAEPMEYGGRGMAMAGIITGIIGTCIAILWIVLNILGVALNGMNGRF